MKCPSCGHLNLTDFPFCEECLTSLPMRPGTSGAGGFDLDRAGGGTATASGEWPAFPWNPKELANPVIGRDRAIKRLVAGFAETTATWTSRLQLLVSEYGMGKARVGKELGRRAVEHDADSLVVVARCPATGGTFRMWDAVLRAAFDIPGSADPAAAGLKLTEAVREFLPDELDDVVGSISHLVGYDTPSRPEPGPAVDVEALNGRGSAALSRLLAAMSIKRPLLIIVNNANRASARSLALASAVEATLKSRPLMLVLAGSPELTEILPGWELFPVTRLGPLSRGDADKMLKLFLTGLERAPKEIRRRILDQSRGNPYAIKSLVRYLREAGGIRNHGGTWQIDEGVAWDLELPDTLEGVVLAQIGTLTSDERRTLARAAVIGQEFWLGAIVALERLDASVPAEPGSIMRDNAPANVRARLLKLEELRFIVPRASALEGEEAYAFRSGVHWSVAQSILPTTTQERFHRIIWQWLLVRVGHAPDRLLADLARHSEAAGVPAAAARYWLQAANAAGSEHRPEEYRHMLESALALVDPDDVATRLAIAFALGDALRRGGDLDGGLARFQEALNLAWRYRHRPKGAAALQRIGCVFRDRGQHDEAYRHLLHALRLFESSDDKPGVGGTCNELGRLFWLRGDFEQALRFYRKAESLYRKLRHRRGLGDAIHHIGALHYDRGDLLLAEEYLGDALDLRRRIDDRAGIIRTLSNLAVLLYGRADADAAVDAWREALTLAISLGDVPAQATLSNNLGEALAAAGQVTGATDHLERAVSLARDTDNLRLLVDALRNRGMLHMSQGDLNAADAALAEAREVGVKLGLSHAAATVERSQGDLEVKRAQAGEQPAWARAATAYAKAAAGFDEGGYDLEVALTREHLAGVLEQQGQDEAAAKEHEAAARLRARHRTREQGDQEHI